VALPADLDQIRVYGTYVDYNGDARSGKFTFTSAVRVRSAAHHTAVVESSVIGILDATGILKAEDGTTDLKLVATDDADGNPTGWTWTVKEEITGLSPRVFNLSVPADGGDLDLTGAAPDVPPVNPGVVAVTRVNSKFPDSTGKVTLVAGDIPAAPVSHNHSATDITSGTVGYGRLPVGTTAGSVAAGDDTRITSAVQPARQVIAGTGLTGGGNLAADRTLSVAYGTAAGTAAQGNDPRLSDARMPTAHAHAIGDTTGLQGALDGKEAAGTAAAGDAAHVAAVDPHTQYHNNTRGDARYALITHAHTVSDVTGLQTALDGKSDSGHTHDYSTLTDIPASFPPDAHVHPVADVTGLQVALDGKETVGAASGAISAHLAAGDPHPQYLTPSEANTVYAPVSHAHNATDITGIPMHAEFSRSGTVTVGSGTFRWYNDSGRTVSITAVRASAGTAPTGAPLAVAVKKNGAAIPGANASLAAGSNSAKNTVSGQTVADGDYLTVDVTAVGSTVPGSDLVVQVWAVIV
jgi:hypothetical protein